jgi:hypothetical protein
MEAKNVSPSFATFAMTRGGSAPNANGRRIAEDKISDTKRVIVAVS